MATVDGPRPQGTREVLEGLYDRSGAPLYRLALAITGDPGISEDLVQEAFARVLERLGDLESIHELDGYLYRMLRNMALKHLRHTRIRKDAKPPGDKVLVVPPEGDLERDEEADRVSRALTSLSLEQREVVVLRVYNSLTFPAIAGCLGIPLGTAHSRYRSGLQRLRALLEPLP